MTIDSFQGPYRYLSNFSPHPIKVGREEWKTVEHAYQASKTSDRFQRRRIANATSPGAAKRIGRHVQLVSHWEQSKLSLMRDLVLTKFSQHAGIRQLLLDTGDELLVEGNTWGDKYWGQVDGEGANNLGEILMAVRTQLRKRETW